MDHVAPSTSKEQEGGTKLLKPFLYGFGAVIFASALWAVITIISGWQVGYVGVGAAFLISKAVLSGSKQQRSTKLQILTILLTSLTVLLANVVIVFYFALQEEGLGSQLLGGLVGVAMAPAFWLPLIHVTALNQGSIGWLIIAATLYAAYDFTNPNKVNLGHANSEKKLSVGVDERSPHDAKLVHETVEASFPLKVDKKIARKVTGFNVLYIACIIAGLSIIFLESISGLVKVVLWLMLSAVSMTAMKQIKVLKQKYPEQFSLIEQVNSKLSFKRIILYSIFGFIGLIVFVVVLGLVLDR